MLVVEMVFDLVELKAEMLASLKAASKEGHWVDLKAAYWVKKMVASMVEWKVE